MPDPFDGYQFLLHLRSRWRLPAATVAAATLVSLAVSLLVPKKYTAHVSMVIEPPAGSDPRVATAVSPVYLESLKTYEHFAASDALFSEAADRFQLRAIEHARSVENLKRDVLKIEIPRNTKILDVAVTLGDAKTAHAVAQYIAEETIKLNRKTNRAGDDELIADAQRSVDESARKLQAAQSARLRFQRRSPGVEALKAELEQLRSLRDEVDRLAISADLTLAEQQARQKSAPADRGETESKLETASGRASELRRRASALDREIAAKQQALADHMAESDRLDARYDAAWAEHDQFEKRLRDLQSSIGFRGERLSLLDPGVVPERPSFPNIPLNLVAAAALGLIVSLFYLTFEFSLRSHKAEVFRKTLRVAAKT
jgi:uncharacterized protein involved in exopolysaccharide biosynthesis